MCWKRSLANIDPVVGAACNDDCRPGKHGVQAHCEKIIVMYYRDAIIHLLDGGVVDDSLTRHVLIATVNPTEVRVWGSLTQAYREIHLKPRMQKGGLARAYV